MIHALKHKPGALLHLAYRRQLFPRDAYRHMFDHLLEHQPKRQACLTMVSLLLLAHERGCEAELAALRMRFAPDPASLPAIHVREVPLAAYQELLDQPDAPIIIPPSAHGQGQPALPSPSTPPR